MAQVERQNWVAAAAIFRRVIALGDGLPQPHGNLGICLLMQDRLDECEVELHRALALDPEYDLALSNLRVLEESRRTGYQPLMGAIRDPFKGCGIEKHITLIEGD